MKTRKLGLFFISLLAVYSGRGDRAIAGDAAVHDDQSAVKVLDDSQKADAPAPPAANDATPPTAPIHTEAPAPHGGQSVTSTQVMVNDAGTVEIHVNNANLLEVLRMLSLQSQRNIVASKEVSGTVTANLYNVTVREALDAILHSNDCSYVEKGNFIYVYTNKEMAEQAKANRKLETRVFSLYYTAAADAMAMVKPVLSPDGNVTPSSAAAKGITTTSAEGASGTGSTDTGGNSFAGTDLLVVTDDADHLNEVDALLKEIDHRPQQVLIEATILAATLNDNNSLGVDFSVMGGVKFDQIMSTPAQTITNASNGSLQNTDKTGKGGYGIGNTVFNNQLPQGGLNIGILTNNISVFIQALEAVSNTTVLANPKVLALDKQSAEVHVGSSDGYNTTTVTQTTSTQTVELFDTGTILSFRPFIGRDGDIRMEIHPEDSTGGVVNGLPHKVITEVTSNVVVKDGRTIVIGGLFREQSQTSRNQIPLLGNIPYLGALFREQQDTTTRQEIIILITPHILKDDAKYSELSLKEQQRAEELRVGVRKGMMFTSRERLAESSYQEALDELHKPKPDREKAIWDLNVATNLNPTFEEAIELKEKVTGVQVTDVDNSSIRSFVSRAILADTATPDSTPQPPEPPMSPPLPATQPVLVPTTQSDKSSP
jgi:type IV pilus assembly protein PilQ